MKRDFDPDPSGLGPGLQSLSLGHGCTLNLAQRELLGADGQPVALRAQALQVLLVLGERAGHVVDKDELMQRVWGPVIVTEDSLVQAIGDIRRALCDAEHRIVRTVPRRGYRLVPLPYSESPALLDTFEPAPAVAAPASVSAAAAAAAASMPAPASAVAISPLPRRHTLPALAGAVLLAVAIAVAAWAAGSQWHRDARDPAPARSLAILPFESVDGTDAWFVDGVASDLHAMLSSWSGSKVVGRGSTAGYKGREVDPRIVGRELGVRHLLTGRARREGDSVRLALSLTDARTGRETWSELRDVPRAELGAAIGDVAGGIARAMVVGLGDAVAASARTLAAHEVQADDLAMQGMAEMLRSVSRESFDGSRRTFETALALDPDCVRCLAGVALSNAALVQWEWAPDRNAAITRAEQMAARLSVIAPETQLAQLAATNIAFMKWDWAGALAMADRLAALYPNDTVSHHYRCVALLRLARFDDSIAACERAASISPRDSRLPTWQGLIAFNGFQLGRWSEAEHAARASVLGNPRVPFYGVVLAAALAEQGRRDEAVAALQETAQRSPDYRASRIAGFWIATEPRFLAGRDRLIARAVELGLPP